MFSIDFVREYLRKKIASSTGRQIFIFLGFYLLVTFFVYSNFMSTQLALKPGQISPRNVRAPHSATIIDEARTSELQMQAAEKVSKVFEEDQEALGKAKLDLNKLFDQINSLKKDETVGKAVRADRIKTLLAKVAEDKELLGYDSLLIATYITNSSEDDMDHIREAALITLEALMAQSVTEESLPAVLQQIRVKTDKLGFNLSARDLVEMAVLDAVRPTLIFDENATQAAMDEAMLQVQPVQTTIQQGQMIVREGDPVTAEQIAVLEQLGVQRSTGIAATLGGIALLVLIFIAISYACLRFYHPRIFGESRLVMLFGLIFFLILAIAKGLTMIQIGGQPEITMMVAYLIPVAAGSMLTAILLDQQLALFFTFIAAVFVGVLTQGNPVPYITTAFVGGAVGVMWVNRLNQTSDLAKSALYLAGANVACVLTMSLLYTGLDSGLVLTAVFFAVLNGFLSAILAIGLLPYLETMFSITSSVKLLDLSNPNHPLLRRLLIEAPGTYHHSIMVGNLAESAAERIGANPLLVRVGAYYHDIGKIKRPYFFVENQLSNDNPHEKIAPSLSALIITSHIKDGVELARGKRIPRPIIDFIEQHHGDSLVRFFYNRALEEDKARKVYEETYRYEGPKPQSKEIALVMLADSVEAAVRSLQDPTPGRIEGMVRRIIKDRLNQGQLEECDLTFRDLNLVAECFSQVLTGVFHSRIEYPETLARELEKRGDGNKDSDNQPTDGL